MRSSSDSNVRRRVSPSLRRRPRRRYRIVGLPYRNHFVPCRAPPVHSWIAVCVDGISHNRKLLADPVLSIADLKLIEAATCTPSATSHMAEESTLIANSLAYSIMEYGPPDSVASHCVVVARAICGKVRDCAASPEMVGSLHETSV